VATVADKAASSIERIFTSPCPPTLAFAGALG